MPLSQLGIEQPIEDRLVWLVDLYLNQDNMRFALLIQFYI